MCSNFRSFLWFLLSSPRPVCSWRYELSLHRQMTNTPTGRGPSPVYLWCSSPMRRSTPRSHSPRYSPYPFFKMWQRWSSIWKTRKSSSSWKIYLTDYLAKRFLNLGFLLYSYLPAHLQENPREGRFALVRGGWKVRQLQVNFSGLQLLSLITYPIWFENSIESHQFILFPGGTGIGAHPVVLAYSEQVLSKEEH